MSLRQTPLYDMHLKYNGKMIDFGGWDLPVQFEGMGIIKEHNMVRESAGLFDVSHMGEFIVKGKQAFELVQRISSNDVAALAIGQAQYSCLPNETGGIVDAGL